MNFLVDAQLPPALASWIRTQGFAAVHVADLGLTGAPDADIADCAERAGAIVVSKDADFLTLRWPDRFALVWLRCGNATNRRLLAWLWSRWPEIVKQLQKGERLVEVV